MSLINLSFYLMYFADDHWLNDSRCVYDRKSINETKLRSIALF